MNQTVISPSQFAFEYADFWEFWHDTTRANSNPEDGDSSGYRFNRKAYDRADFKARNGNPALEAQLFTATEQLKNKINTRTAQPTLQWADNGPDVDIDRYLSGEPECFYTYPLEMRAGGRTVKITINGSFASADTDFVINRGAAVLALADAIEQSGYRTEILYTSCSGCAEGETRRNTRTASGRSDLIVTFPVKTGSSAVDISRMVYAFCDEEMFQKHVFHWREILPPNIRQAVGCWERASMNPHDDAIINFHKPDVMIGSDFTYFSNLELSRYWVTQQLKNLEIGQGALAIADHA